MIAIPAVDLREGRCVQLVGGRPEEEKVSLPDPVGQAGLWWKMGFGTLHIVDLDAALGLGRTPIDTDRPFSKIDFDIVKSLDVEVPDDYAVLYTCPPDGSGDQRLQRFLSVLPHVPARFVYLSTTGVYGDADGDWIDESTPVDAQAGRARRRLVRRIRWRIGWRQLGADYRGHGTRRSWRSRQLDPGNHNRPRIH